MFNQPINAYWFSETVNAGDLITTELFPNAKQTKQGEKHLICGSIIWKAQAGDIVAGAGQMWGDIEVDKTSVTFKAVRGPLTRNIIVGAEVPEVYGDPAILMPLIYNPEVDQDKEVGYLPHYADKAYVQKNTIDIQQNPKDLIKEMKRYKKIVTSSLHGIILAEVYGLEVEWVKYSNEISGGTFKFRDYLYSTGREIDTYGLLPPVDMSRIKEMQQGLIEVYKSL